MRLPKSLRGRLALVLGAGALVTLAALIAGFNVVLRHGLDNDLDARLRERASAALANVDIRGPRVSVRESPGDQAIDQQVWVFANARAVESPLASPAVNRAAAALARTPGSFRELSQLDLRLYARRLPDVTAPPVTIVVGASLRPFEATARRALIASIVLGALVLAGILLAVRLAVSAALRPVDRMTAEAAAWSVDHLDQRFADLGTSDELARLASTFNDLLGRLAASFRHEQRFSAELSHELRTPLARLIAEAEIALRRERTPNDYRAALEAVVSDAREMQRVTETLLAVARAEIDPRSGTSDANEVARAVADSRRVPDGPELLVRPAPAELRVGVDADVAERVLAPVIDNALRFARSRASIALEQRDGAVAFVICDDGPGVAAEESEAIFAPGSRGGGRAANGSSAGVGLGLALARRLARAAGGEVACDASAESGRFVVTLPPA